MKFCDQCQSLVSVDETYQCPVPKHITDNNEPPLSSEMPGLRTMLRETEHELEMVNNQIRIVNQLLESLQRRKESIEQSLGVNQGALSSVRRVPREILTRIFSMALRENEGMSLRTRGTIWHLNRVCRIWADASLLLSAWGFISASYHERSGSTVPSEPAKLLTAILERNATVGRRVRLSLDISSSGPHAQALLDAAIDHSEVWQHAAICVHSDLQGLRRLHNRIPYLEHLEIEGGHNVARDFGPAFQVAPSLHTFSAKSITRLPDIPWSQIEKFSYTLPLQTLPFDVLPRLLQKMPKLRKFEGWATFQAPLSHLPVPMNLGMLQSLRLSGECLELAPSFAFPALKELTNVLPRHYHTLITLLKRCQCRITKLGLVQTLDDGLAEGTQRLFPHLPGLRTLSLFTDFSDPEFQNDLLFGLTENVPSLTELHLTVKPSWWWKKFNFSATQTFLRGILDKYNPVISVRFDCRDFFLSDGTRASYSNFVEEFGNKVRIEPLNT